MVKQPKGGWINLIIRFYKLDDTFYGHLSKKVCDKYNLKSGLYLCKLSCLTFIARVYSRSHPYLGITIPKRIAWYLNLKPRKTYLMKIMPIEKE